MSQTIDTPETRVSLNKAAGYRDTYANSVQIRLSVWDIFLVFGTLEQQSQNQVNVENFQGIYLSPQQAKALSNLLAQNVTQYEQTFGPISLEGNTPGSHTFVVPGNGPIH